MTSSVALSNLTKEEFHLICGKEGDSLNKLFESSKLLSSLQSRNKNFQQWVTQ